MSSWSENDEQILREQYPNVPAKNLSEKLNRTEAAIHSKASRLNISKEGEGERSSKCEKCGQEYTFGGENSWSHTALCRACYDKCRRRSRKEKIINKVFDGECEACGYSECIRALNLHHKNPDEKKFGLSDMLRRSWEDVLKECKKCKLLCANCHQKHHCDKCISVPESG